MDNYKAKDSLGFWLSRSARLANQHFESYLKQFKFTPNEYAVLNCIYNKISQNPGEIADYLRMDRGYITRQIEKLENKSVLRRSVDPKNRRLIQVILTRKGEKLYPKLVQGSHQTNKQLTKVLTKKEATMLRNLLIKVGETGFKQ